VPGGPTAVPWRGRDALGAGVVVVPLTFLAGMVGMATGPSILFPLLTAMVGVGAIAWASFYRRPGALLGSGFRIGLRPVGPAVLGWLAVFGAQIVLGVIVAALFGPDALPDRGGLPRELVQGPTWSLLLGAVVVAPVAEELFFRGLLLQGLARSYGPRIGVAGSALVFGLFHFSGPSIQTVLPMLSATVVGLVLGWLFVRTANLTVPVLTHALVNGVALVVAGLLSG
jgi:membrane protease YdiL (CAAX protease family)